MHEEIIGLLGMLKMSKPSNKVAARTKARFTAGLCLLCESATWQRGLCSKCYFRYRAELMKRKTKTNIAKFESECVRQGKILARQAARQIKSDNPFTRVG